MKTKKPMWLCSTHLNDRIALLDFSSESVCSSAWNQRDDGDLIVVGQFENQAWAYSLSHSCGSIKVIAMVPWQPSHRRGVQAWGCTRTLRWTNPDEVCDFIYFFNPGCWQPRQQDSHATQWNIPNIRGSESMHQAPSVNNARNKNVLQPQRTEDFSTLNRFGLYLSYTSFIFLNEL
jgi:hypothetical protein